MRLARLLCTAAVALTAAAPMAAVAQGTGHMLVGFPPGGAVDILGRLFAAELAQSEGHPVIVENRPGAVGQIAAQALKAAAPDGNTLMLAPDASVVIRPLTLKNPPFDPLADFAPVAHTGSWDLAFAVNAEVPAKNLREFAGWAKANPARSVFGSAGAGGSTHFYGLMLAQAMGVELRHVPYKGAGPAITDLVAGHISSAVQPLGTLLQQAHAGKIRILAVSGKQRSEAAPDVPTAVEQGYPSLGVEGWFGIFAPAATPPDTVGRLNAIVVQALRKPEVKERMRNLDLGIRELTPAQFAALVKADYERWGPIVKASGFSGDAP